MTKKNENITVAPLTKEMVEEVLHDLKDEMVKEMTASVASLQLKVDAKSLMKLGLDRLGLKTNYMERIAWAGGGFGLGLATAASFINYFM